MLGAILCRLVYWLNEGTLTHNDGLILPIITSVQFSGVTLIGVDRSAGALYAARTPSLGPGPVGMSINYVRQSDRYFEAPPSASEHKCAPGGETYNIFKLNIIKFEYNEFDFLVGKGRTF